MSIDHRTRSTEKAGSTASWFADNGVIHVVSVRYAANGEVSEFEDAPTLGECFGRIPRALWEQVRYDYHHGSHENRERGETL
ncbi:hypothetical protein ACFQZZ_21585 [Nocardia sp. GCM10030253]|uniref:hypothetical protein n=1 Tax=Nocardia sp. GCM10030253 TaxID=3273404 RepID=UPI00362834B3